jgi:hypothetical protein
MDNATARGLYMGGMPIGQGTNGVIIGPQVDIQLINPGTMTFAFNSRDNYWNNIAPGVWHTDFNNVDGGLNRFFMTYPTNDPLQPATFFNNNSQNNVTNPNDPLYTFQSAVLNTTTLDCSVTRMEDVYMDVLDDIALDSIIKLGGNDTSRYFGKEFLYSLMKYNDSLSNVTELAQFKLDADNSNLKPIYVMQQGLVYPIDSVAIDSLGTISSSIIPINNLENNYKEVFELALINPNLKDSIYSPQDLERLRYIASLCPFTDGSAVYTARVILHGIEPDSNYYNYCEFVKKPDRESSERNANEHLARENTFRNNLDYILMPNPNNGAFQIWCPDNKPVAYSIYDSKGNKVVENIAYPTSNIISIRLNDVSSGLYNVVIATSSKRISFKMSVIRN